MAAALDPGTTPVLVGSASMSLASLPLCPWRSSELSEQECTHYLDCPSHTFERRHNEAAVPMPPTTPNATLTIAPIPATSPTPATNPTTTSTASPRQTARPPSTTASTTASQPGDGSDGYLPRWQPDVEVTICPICNTQFSIFVRKHHCRKCGRVVCHSCSPHRITIPYQYIVRPPGQPIRPPRRQSSTATAVNDASSDPNFGSIGGGERVRLCNPCVPDPNTAPPPSRAPPGRPPRISHARTQSGLAGTVYAATVPSPDVYSRSRSVTTQQIRTVVALMPAPAESSSQPVSGTVASPIPSSASPASPSITSTVASSSSSSQRSTGSGLYRALLSMAGSSSSQGTAVPSSPLPPQGRQDQIAEEDECPVCHLELPSRTLPAFESLRETHISTCITTHSSYRGSSMPGLHRGGGGISRNQRRTGMFPYLATEKDCVDSAECTICLEEFEVGVQMARLECLCRFHRACISAWFVSHPGRCPVHQHDGFGF